MSHLNPRTLFSTNRHFDMKNNLDRGDQRRVDSGPVAKIMMEVRVGSMRVLDVTAWIRSTG